MGYSTAFGYHANVNKSDFFDAMIKKSKKIADREADKMADSMVFILRHRQQLKGGSGQYPKWDGSNGKASKHSHNYWEKARFKDGYYYVKNDFRDPATGYSYVRNLMYGTGWRTNGMQPFPRLVAKNGRLFSTQLPDGLDPWLKVKRKDLKRNLLEAFRQGALT